MIINRFAEIRGISLTEIPGQNKLAYALSTLDGFYDLLEWQETGGHPGGTISFYNLETGQVDTPFEKKRNVLYGQVIFAKGGYYFLKCDYEKKEIVLYKYLIDGSVQAITTIDGNQVDLYNLLVQGEDVHITSQDEEFICYYPEKFSFKMDPHESAILISDGKVYLNRWIEEGWDYENNRGTDEYKLYDMLVIRDFNGNILSEEIGVLDQTFDGRWWLV